MQLTGLPAAAPETTVGASTPLWLGRPERPLAARLHLPADRRVRGAVVLCPAVGYEYALAHQSFRLLAESLAARGLAALRLDYDGVGDSWGDDLDPGRVPAWRASVITAVAALRARGAADVALLGLRIGGTLAAAVAGEVDAAALALWDPVVAGSEYVRRLRAIARIQGSRLPQGQISADGTVLTDETLADLSALTLAAGDPGRPVLAVLREGAQAPAALDGATVLHRPGQPELFGADTLAAVVPTRTLTELADWLAARAPAGATELADGGLGSVTVDRVRETFVTYEGMAGVLTEPASPGPTELLAEPASPGRPSELLAELASPGRPSELLAEPASPGRPSELLAEPASPGVLGEPPSPGAPGRPTVVLLNTSVDPHVGPSRAWVGWARELATLGLRSVRVDLSGLGDSPAHPGAGPQLPYGPHAVADVRALTRAVDEGAGVVLAGLCSGARNAMDAASGSPVVDLLLVNPALRETRSELERVRPGRTPPAGPAERDLALRIRQAVTSHLPRPAWWAIHRAGLLAERTRVLHESLARGTQVLLVYSRGDYVLLKPAHNARFAMARLRRTGRFTQQEIVADHALVDPVGRRAVLDALTAYLVRRYPPPA